MEEPVILFDFAKVVCIVLTASNCIFLHGKRQSLSLRGGDISINLLLLRQTSRSNLSSIYCPHNTVEKRAIMTSLGIVNAMKTRKYRGILKKWKDDRGFGFIKSDIEAREIFIHISALKRAKRRPKVGDVIFYDLKTQADGKVCAANALIEGATFKKRLKKQRRKNNKLLEIATTVVIAGAVIAHVIITSENSSRRTSTRPRTTSAVNPECKIKGNISHNSGNKVYHVPGQEDYQSTKIDITRGERWFCTEEEARQNGWRKAPR